MNATKCPVCGHHRPGAPRIVLEACALILHRTGYSIDQILEHSTIGVRPLEQKALTVDLLEAGAAHLRTVGFTYHGVWDTVARLRAQLGGQPAPASRAAAQQLVLDGGQP